MGRAGEVVAWHRGPATSALNISHRNDISAFDRPIGADSVACRHSHWLSTRDHMSFTEENFESFFCQEALNARAHFPLIVVISGTVRAFREPDTARVTSEMTTVTFYACM